MPMVKRKLVGMFFENKEIKSKINTKNKIEDINKNIKIDFHKAKLEEHKKNKKNELIEQNNNSSNIDILNIFSINQIEYNTKKKLNKNNCKETDLKNMLSLKVKNPREILNKKRLYSSSSKKNNESLSLNGNFKFYKPQNKYNKRKMKYIFPYYYFLLDLFHFHSHIFYLQTSFLIY